MPDYEAFNDEEFGAVRAVTTGGGPAFDPPEGDWFMATAANSAHYQRLTRTFSVPALGAGETADLSVKSLGLVDGPGIATGHSLFWGFGLEGVEDPADRAALLDDAMARFGITG
jgi:hypothetical protein